MCPHSALSGDARNLSLKSRRVSYSNTFLVKLSFQRIKTQEPIFRLNCLCAFQLWADLKGCLCEPKGNSRGIASFWQNTVQAQWLLPHRRQLAFLMKLLEGKPQAKQQIHVFFHGLCCNAILASSIFAAWALHVSLILLVFYFQFVWLMSLKVVLFFSRFLGQHGSFLTVKRKTNMC